MLISAREALEGLRDGNPRCGSRINWQVITPCTQVKSTRRRKKQLRLKDPHAPIRVMSTLV